MSLQAAYTTGFRSLDGNTWQIRIDVDGHQGAPVEISLEGDEPCVIEWQETGKTDVVQGATCTLRVSNESDRQMLQLMSRPEAAVFVSLNGKEYWRGQLDDAVYEEPYSYTRAYVTELTFSDFGSLNRRPFTLRGRQSVRAIIEHCLDGSGLDWLYKELLTPLTEPKTQQPITLDMLYINADRYAPDPDSWSDATSRREVLEEVLRPLGLHIMQKNQCIHIYDPEWLRDHDSLHHRIVWKGDDAFLRGAERYGRFEVEFDTDANETLAELGIDTDNEAFTERDALFGMVYSENSVGQSVLLKGFYVEPYRNGTSAPGIWHPHAIHVPAVIFPNSAVSIADAARWFRTRSVMADASDVGVAWRIVCQHIIGYEVLGEQHVPVYGRAYAVDNKTGKSLADTRDVFKIETGYLPIVPDGHKFELRINLDMLFSFRDNPIGDAPEEWAEAQDWHTGYESAFLHSAYLVPVKLEVVNENGDAICHYVNASSHDYTDNVFHTSTMADAKPLGIGRGLWMPGAAQCGEMVLAYYKDFDPDVHDYHKNPFLGGWTSNRMALMYAGQDRNTLYSVRDDGEYIPMPPAAGRLRLTVGSGVFPSPVIDNQFLSPAYTRIAWHLFRNPEIAIVRANRRDDGIKTDPVHERRDGPPDSDLLSETTSAGTWRKGIAPSARGLFFDSFGIVWEKFAKGVMVRTLEELRINYLEEQTSAVQPVLEGTAELDPAFGAKTEALTPGTEHVTMARIANAGGLVYEFSWSDPLCVLVESPYTFEWDNPVCATVEGPYTFEWGDPVCALRYEYTLEWDALPPEYHDD